MFERKKPAAPQKRIDSLIGAGTVVEGDVMFCGGLRIDGSVQGNVSTVDGQPGTLVISEQARVDGEVSVSHVVINGSVNGPVRADDYLELQAKARIVGDVRYRRARDADRRGGPGLPAACRTGGGAGGRIETGFGVTEWNEF